MKALAGWVLAATAFQVAAIEVCETDRIFAQQGWILHTPDEFGGILQTALQRIDKEVNLGQTSVTSVYNVELNKFIVRIAFDQADTSPDTMIDDLVLYVDEETRAFYEVRWFDGGKKHIAYTGLRCANRPVPWAENSMW